MKSANSIGLFGIGFFSLSIFYNFGFVLRKLLHESMLLMEIKPIINHGITEYVTMIIGVLIILLILKKLMSININDLREIKRLLIRVIIVLIVLAVIPFLTPFIIETYASSDYFKLMEWHYIGLEKYPIIKGFAIDVPTDYLPFIVIGGFIYLRIRRNSA